MSPGSLGPKRRRLLDVEDDEVAMVLDTTRMANSRWIESTLAFTCETAYPGWYFVNDTVPKSCLEPNYTPFPSIMEQVRNTRRILFLLHLDETAPAHWTVATMQIESGDAVEVEYFDSLPNSPGSLRTSTRMLEAFIRHYLPESDRRPVDLVQRAVPQQNNGVDCGYYAFCFCIHIITETRMPRTVAVTVWRHMLTAYLGHPVDDWTGVLPDETQAAEREDEDGIMATVARDDVTAVIDDVKGCMRRRNLLLWRYTGLETPLRTLAVEAGQAIRMFTKLHTAILERVATLQTHREQARALEDQCKMPRRAGLSRRAASRTASRKRKRQQAAWRTSCTAPRHLSPRSPAA
ncbi:hypothetical protein Ct61P_15599 [Colletotrichum tofieldiae]|nr:hypothetical protein Ct61P_15599 [Colletotrichum tofieldiae]